MTCPCWNNGTQYQGTLATSCFRYDWNPESKKSPATKLGVLKTLQIDPHIERRVFRAEGCQPRVAMLAIDFELWHHRICLLAYEGGMSWHLTDDKRWRERVWNTKRVVCNYRQLLYSVFMLVMITKTYAASFLESAWLCFKCWWWKMRI